MLPIQQAVNIREILLCSTLSERPIKVEFKQGHPSYLQQILLLFSKLQSGCKIEVNAKGLVYIPGIITNNSNLLIEFDCGAERSIAYYLEPIIILSLYGKQPVQIEFTGLTNDELDQSVDSILNCLIPLLKKFIPEWNPTLKINRRGYRPHATGKVYFVSHPIKYVKSIDLTVRGPIKRIRGVVSGQKVAPNILNRIVGICREVFNDYIPDVWVHTDLQKNQKGVQMANGYAISLVAESTEKQLISIDHQFNEKESPEQMAEKAALSLLDEIENSGCIDSTNQQYALIMMALGEKKLSNLRVGRITVHTIETLRLLRDFFGVTFQITSPEGKKEQENDQMEIEIVSGNNDQENLESKTEQTMIFSCLGSGIVNMSRQLV